MRGSCTLPDCEAPEHARGLCNAHYRRARRAGEISARTPEERFWSRVEKTATCWIWEGGKTQAGYGTFRLNGRTLLVHRLSYELAYGHPVPEGLVTDHLCRNRACVNPEHLEPVTNRENILRGTSPAAQAAQKTHCKRGHEFTPENTYILKAGRACRTCHRNRQNARRALVTS